MLPLKNLGSTYTLGSDAILSKATSKVLEYKSSRAKQSGGVSQRLKGRVKQKRAAVPGTSTWDK